MVRPRGATGPLRRFFPSGDPRDTRSDARLGDRSQVGRHHQGRDGENAGVDAKDHRGDPTGLVAREVDDGRRDVPAVTGRAELMDAVPPGGLGGTFGGNPLSCAAAVAVLEALREPEFLDNATRVGERVRRRLDELAARHPEIGEVRGLGPMLAFEFAERTPDRAQAAVAAAFERGLILLSCGLYGNVLRLLPPLTVADDELDRGFAILDEALAVAG